MNSAIVTVTLGPLVASASETVPKFARRNFVCSSTLVAKYGFSSGSMYVRSSPLGMSYLHSTRMSTRRDVAVTMWSSTWKSQLPAFQ